MMTVNNGIRIADCTDGTSNTLMVGEQSGSVGTQDLRNWYVGGWAGAAMDGYQRRGPRAPSPIRSPLVPHGFRPD